VKEVTKIRCPKGAIVVKPLGDNWWEFEYPRLGWDVYDEFEDAIDTWEVGLVEIAEKGFRKLIREFPEFIDAHHHLALLLDEEGREREAFQIWRDAVALGLSCLPEEFAMGRDLLPWGCLDNRPFLRAYQALGLEYLERGAVADALGVFQNILAVNPNDNQGVRALAIDCNFVLRRPDRVLEICDRYPEDGMEYVMYGRALALYQQGQHVEAEAALREAIEYLPLVAQELVKKRHRAPKDLRPDSVTIGGPDQAYYYWKEQGQHWKKTSGAIEFVAKGLETTGAGSEPTAFGEVASYRDDAAVDEVERIFNDLIGCFGYHVVAAGEEVYLQPYVALSLHLVQMLAAGWADVDFDQIAAVSGASALFAYQRGEFMPKYAHVYIGLDQRIADATGFGYEWVNFQGVQGAWELIRESVDAGRPVNGWHWENILFSNYRDAAQAQDRQVFAMGDGPETFARWWTWDELAEYVKLVEGWGCPQFGRHTQRIQAEPAEEVARRVMRDLVAWSVEPPEVVREKFPKATFGLAGIEAYAADCERTDVSETWVACHDINPQWTIRNSTSVYLKRVVEAAVFPEDVNRHLVAAAVHYRAAYECWQVFYDLLGHDIAENLRKMADRRLAGADAVRAWLEHEKSALDEIEQALSLVG